MAINNSEVIDFIGVNEMNNEVILTISDHFNWEGVDEHLKALQDKLNSYINFVESGEIFQTYADAINRNIIIEVVGNYKLPTSAVNFYKHTSKILAELNIKLRFKNLS